MLSILCSRIQGYMLSLLNEVDPWLLLPLRIFYEMQNQIFQHTKDPNLNAITTNPLVLESDNISLVSTLAASHQTNHVITNSCDELNISTAEINVQPANIRSWKRIMHQANPNGATDTLDLEKKRKVSTCMASTSDFPYK